MYQYIKEGRYPISTAQIRRENPQSAIPSPTYPQHVEHLGYAPVLTVSHPEMTENQYCEEGPPEYRDGDWWQTWVVKDKPPKSQGEVIKQYETELDTMLDGVAKGLTFKDRHALALRAAYPNQWQTLGIAFGTWMDGVNAQAWQIMSEVLAGTRPLPTVGEFLALFPAFETPV